VKALLMGGQACILYGAAEFTRDSDFLVSADEVNLGRLRAALAALKAEPVYVPLLSAETLRRGHACHFRCMAGPLAAWRVDIMAVLRGADDFEELWGRRTVVSLPGHGRINVLAVEDLVRAKKTQRDKDWPMIARLVQADYLSCGKRPPRQRIAFWLAQARTAELLLHLVRRFRGTARRLTPSRAAIAAATRGNRRQIEAALAHEQRSEREDDRRYWAPLRAELQRLRRRPRADRCR